MKIFTEMTVMGAPLVKGTDSVRTYAADTSSTYRGVRA